jgi:NADH:ubiquinone oxidoreductase subunit 6 (subunit J)
MPKGKRGFNALIAGGISIFILIFVITIAAYMTDILEQQQTTGSTAENISQKGLAAFDLFGDWFKILVILIIMVVVIGLILSIRFFRGGGGGF